MMDFEYPILEVLKLSKSTRILGIQQSMLRKIGDILRQTGKNHSEEVVYIYGIENQPSLIDYVLAIGVPHATKSYGHFRVNVENITKLSKSMISSGLICLAQFHSHPGSYDQHSHYDNENAISTSNGFLSFVAPKFGNVNFDDFKEITVHEAWDYRWSILSKSAVNKRIKVFKDIVNLRRNSNE